MAKIRVPSQAAIDAYLRSANVMEKLRIAGVQDTVTGRGSRDITDIFPTILAGDDLIVPSEQAIKDYVASLDTQMKTGLEGKGIIFDD